MKTACFFIAFLVIVSCKSKEENILINGKNDLWRVVQIGKYRSDSSLMFFRLNSDNSYNELYFFDEQYEEIDSNPDIDNYHKWKFINDTTIEIAYIKYRVFSLTNNFALFGNIKRLEDSLVLERVEIEKETSLKFR